MGTMIALSFALYALYVLLPLIPAVVIFKLFPKTSVSVSGPLQNFTINATGAFGAYLVTVLLGYFLVDRIDDRIDTLRHPVLTYEAELQLQDENQKPIEHPSAEVTKELEVELVDPKIRTAVYPKLYVTVPLKRSSDRVEIHLTLPGFEPTPLILNEDNTRLKTTDSGAPTRVVMEPNPIVLRQLPSAMTSEPYRPRAALSPTEGGPPIEP